METILMIAIAILVMKLIVVKVFMHEKTIHKLIARNRHELKLEEICN